MPKIKRLAGWDSIEELIADNRARFGLGGVVGENEQWASPADFLWPVAKKPMAAQSKFLYPPSPVTAEESNEEFKRQLEALDQIFGIDRSEECSHDFKLYEGFTEKYEWCVHCDHKREVKL